MSRSRENVRQNKAMQSILRGETPEKRIFVSKVDKEFQEKIKLEKEIEKKRIDEKFEATKEARMPWFCGECKKIMKRRLDEKMWYLYQHCFECQIEVENKLRINGEYDKWSQQKIRKDVINAIKTVKSGGDIKKIQTLKLQLDKLNKIGGLNSIVPSEGIVFKYKGKTYKFTGAFAPVNQILGLLNF